MSVCFGVSVRAWGGKRDVLCEKYVVIVVIVVVVVIVIVVVVSPKLEQPPLFVRVPLSVWWWLTW